MESEHLCIKSKLVCTPIHLPDKRSDIDVLIVEHEAEM